VSETSTGAAGTDTAASRPEALADVEEERIRDVDVREQLRQGGEPFERIMAAASDVPEDGVLRVRAIFEPRPLYSVLSSRGFRRWTEQLGEEDWRVWFWRPASG
jgi:hypothetical protein